MGTVISHTVGSGFLWQKTGKIAVVLALLCLAFFLFKPITVKAGFYRVTRYVLKAQMMWQTRTWDELEGTHFIVRYLPQDDNIADMVLASAEKDYQPVSQNFGYLSQERILVVIYPTKQSLGRSFGWAADESAMGVYWAGVIRVLSPNVWVEEENPAHVRWVFESEGPMAHELTHLIVDYSTGGNYTRWFTEGIAQYEEAKLTGYRMEHDEIRRPDEMYPLIKMDGEFDSLENQNLAYFESYQAVKFLVENYGEESLREILDSLSKGRSMKASFRSTLGIAIDQFERDFKMWSVQNSSNDKP
ncbi:MAG: hypothetical protein CVV03_01040 [Firmicutes bacterium HGW-Firmicutes-8]|nr:MAG: hypothetical protein CVV03_01040 [Firmicutes bacterium HGW-Firmicutes-8]